MGIENRNFSDSCMVFSSDWLLIELTRVTSKAQFGECGGEKERDENEKQEREKRMMNQINNLGN